MSTETAVHTAVVGRIAANVASIDATWTVARVQWPNESLDIEGKASFMELYIDFDEARQGALGSAKLRLEGRVRCVLKEKSTHGARAGGSAIQGRAGALRALFPLGLSLAAGSRYMRFAAPEPEPLDPSAPDGLIELEIGFPFYIYE